MSNIVQPKWLKPAQKPLPTLKVLNSLTREKEPFITIQPNHVTWYVCGPTVYNKSHLGHARTYIGFDIIRRVMCNYFGYDSTFVMNITDIDDKIILNARKEYLVKQYREKHHTSSQFVKDVQDGWNSFVTGKLTKFGYSEGKWDDFVKKFESGAIIAEEEPKLGLYVKTAKDCLQAIGKVNDLDEEQVYSQCHDILATFLDGKFGDTVTNPAIYKDFAQFWERDFFTDMKALNILEPDILTRVSEYVPEIVDYVNKIMTNGYAYESDGSVYFDTRKFHEDRVYCKLAPGNASNLKLVEEGEGVFFII
jgi:cysteinyl-tRNA synthetase